MTIFGTDISNYQAGLNLARLADASFVIAKCSEGTYYTDAAYPGWRAQAAALAKPFAWYHFLSGEDPNAQAAHNLACVGDRTLPGMLDAELEGNFHPSLAQILAYIDAAHAAGLNLRLCYLPRWYWQQIGSPDLSGLTARGVYLVSSMYPSASSGTPTGLYPGDNAAGWQPYGGVTPLLYQYTSQGADGGQYLDYNAYKGTVADLTAVLLGTTPPSGGSNMPNIPPSISQKWPDIAGDFPPNAPYTDDTAIIWSDAGARAAALYAREARDAINALAAKIGAPPAIDVNALAAAIAPHLSAGATADQIAQAVAAHLTLTVGAK